MKLKVGDHVRILNTKWVPEPWIDRTGIIVDILKKEERVIPAWPYKVKFKWTTIENEIIETTESFSKKELKKLNSSLVKKRLGIK